MRRAHYRIANASETTEKIGCSLRDMELLHRAHHRIETPVSCFPDHTVNLPQRCASFPPKESCLPVDRKSCVSGHSYPMVGHVFGQRNCLTRVFFRAYRPAPSMPTSSQVNVEQANRYRRIGARHRCSSRGMSCGSPHCGAQFVISRKARELTVPSRMEAIKT